MAGMQIAYKKKEAPETVSVPKEHLQTVISSAGGAKINKLKEKHV